MSDARTQAIAQRLKKMNLSRDMRDMAAKLERQSKRLCEMADDLMLDVDAIEREHGLGIYAAPTPQGSDGIPLDVGIAYQCKS